MAYCPGFLKVQTNSACCPGSIDIGGLKLSNVGGTLSVSTPGSPATPIAGEDTWVRAQANASFLQANASFNSAFEDQLSKNKLERMLNEEKKLAYLTDNNTDTKSIDNKVRLFHTLTISEVVDNLANSIVTLFQQVYTLDYNGMMNSQDNYIYYGIVFILSYIILSMVWNQLNDT